LRHAYPADVQIDGRPEVATGFAKPSLLTISDIASIRWQDQVTYSHEH
jgi:hypothetical protein